MVSYSNEWNIFYWEENPQNKLNKQTADRDFNLSVPAMPGDIVQTVPRHRPPRSVTPPDKPRVQPRTSMEIEFPSRNNDKN